MLVDGQQRQDAVKKYLSDTVMASLEQSDRAEWFKAVKASVDAPVAAPARGILGRLLWSSVVSEVGRLLKFSG